MGLAAQGVYRKISSIAAGREPRWSSIQQTLDQYFRAITQRQRKAITQMPARQPRPGKSITHPSAETLHSCGGRCLRATGFHLMTSLHTDMVALSAPSGMHHFDEIIPMGSSYPSKRPVAVTWRITPEQELVEFVIARSTQMQLSSAQTNEQTSF
jgi:hypothetical protein